MGKPKQKTHNLSFDPPLALKIYPSSRNFFGSVQFFEDFFG
ncbi:hypothetical protein HMPREF0388_1418 [Mobiluncus curtisii ATCC 51333]|uniref:Uncharacterized protein n=1 Tax=Mobiluncus curtisii ATCC 51333 TaxID=887326 RepID=E6M035_9ACTO|nr:hypothetical protein HMPREF0388_1418 [Mobiluncus curtisii ATCC 51333]